MNKNAIMLRLDRIKPHYARIAMRFCYGFLLAACILPLAGCISAKHQARLARENEELHVSVKELERELSDCNLQTQRVSEQLANLQAMDSSRPADLFAPVKLEIASLSGGANYDDRVGDDGVTVHLRLRDIDGDTVKAPGKITIQLVDNSTMGQPTVLGVYSFSSAEELRKTWHGRFGTQHYTLRCPFESQGPFPATPRVDVRAEFVSYLTGIALTAFEEVTVNRAVG